MTQPEYEQKRAECWHNYFSADKRLTTTYEHEISKDAFYSAFDRAYSLGKQAKAAEGEEMLSAEKSKVQTMYDNVIEIIANNPIGSEVHSMAMLTKELLRELFGSKCLPDAEIFDEPTAKNPKETAKTFASDESTDTKSDDFDRIVKGGFRGHNRLHVAAMAMQGILSSDDWSPWRGGADGEIYRNMARAALAHADALIAECELSTQSLCSEKKGGEK